ncbi:O-acetyl-ADP-ribose deacetylase [Geminicoccaceae bacterium 1502E]|nr:O-acetyl-ADP-ribose deacetylase [Geminicoccaceae bacterium 1502E]
MAAPEASARGRMRVVQGDITTLAVDAIVNAANEELLPGGGVCGAIHRAAGPKLAEECARLGGCPTGEARITGGHDLPARHVIHTVGPLWDGGEAGEAEELASCYRRSLQLAYRHGLRSVAFPAISTGVFGYPDESAAAIAVREVARVLAERPELEEVIFCCFSSRSAMLHERALAALGKGS